MGIHLGTNNQETQCLMHAAAFESKATQREDRTETHLIVFFSKIVRASHCFDVLCFACFSVSHPISETNSFGPFLLKLLFRVSWGQRRLYVDSLTNHHEARQPFLGADDQHDNRSEHPVPVYSSQEW